MKRVYGRGNSQESDTSVLRVIGMKVNSGSGACAYVIAPAKSPLDVDVAKSPWHVSMENGGFSKQPEVRDRVETLLLCGSCLTFKNCR